MRTIILATAALVAIPPSARAGDEKITEQKIEPHVKAAYQAALQKLPAPARERMHDLKLVRTTDLGIKKDAPLEYRLLNRAPYASFSVMKTHRHRL